MVVCTFVGECKTKEPIYFVTMMKSGTHLLEKYLKLLLSTTDEQYEKINSSIERRYIGKGVGDKSLFLKFSHIATPGKNRLEVPDRSKMILLIRDPRDVLISAIHFIPTMPKGLKGVKNGPFIHQWSKYTTEERITSLLTEKCLDQNLEKFLNKNFLKKEIFPPSMTNFLTQGYRAIELFERPNTLVIRFEDLVGQQGGGCSQAQYQAMEEIALFIGKEFNEEVYEKISKDLFGATKTFRKGKIGSWKQELSEGKTKNFLKSITVI